MKMKKWIVLTAVLSFVMTLSLSFPVMADDQQAKAGANGKIKVHVLHCGQVRTMNVVPYGISWGMFFRITRPVAAYLIETPKGKVLVDTGWNTTSRTSPFKEVGIISYPVSTPILPEGQAIDEQLARMGLAATDVDYVTFTHLDADHASGLKRVAGAKNIIVDQAELSAANTSWLRYGKHMWEGVTMKTFEMKASEYGPQKRSYDVFGDGSVILVSTPGHTEGHVSVLVRNQGKFVLIVGDVGYEKNSWEKMILPGGITSKEKEIQALQWVKAMAADPNCIETLATHDPAVVPHTIEF